MAAKLRFSAAVGALIAGFFAPATAAAQAEEEYVAERVHSNLPLFTFDWEDLWPRHFVDDDGFGCTSRVAFGDWHFLPDEMGDSVEEYWWRLRNYGAFHCAAIFESADELADLESSDFDYGFFVRLDTVRHEGKDWELWAFQVGTIPGSDYALLARNAKDDELIEEFNVLQRHCPDGRLLEAESMNIWLTRYCAINSPEELISLAKEMLELPPLGTITRVAD